MSKITKSLHYQKIDDKGTVTASGSCILYSSKDDCAGYSTIPLEVDKTTVYAGLGTSLSANNASGIRIQKTGSDTKYAILKWTQATITITQVDNETIAVTDAKGNAIASGSLLPMNTALTITVTAKDGYKAGSITINGNEVTSPYSITQADIESGTIVITAKAATVNTATVTIIQSDHQTIHVYTPQKEGGTDHTETFTCPIGTTYEAEVIGDSGYLPGDLSVGDTTSGGNKPTGQVFVAKGSSPWYNNNTDDGNWGMWPDASKVTKTDESVSGQVTVTCSGVTDMRYMFYNCSSLTSLDLSNFDTSNVTDMNSMFSNCNNLTSLDLSNFHTSNVTDMDTMFSWCSSLTSLDLSNFDTSNVTDMNTMFSTCNNLTSLDLSNFDTSNVTNMSYMFVYCTNLTSIKGIIDMKSCTYYDDMFTNCTKLTGVKIKNPPSGFNGGGLSSSQYTIVS